MTLLFRKLLILLLLVPCLSWGDAFCERGVKIGKWEDSNYMRLSDANMDELIVFERNLIMNLLRSIPPIDNEFRYKIEEELNSNDIKRQMEVRGYPMYTEYRSAKNLENMLKTLPKIKHTTLTDQPLNIEGSRLQWMRYIAKINSYSYITEFYDLYSNKILPLPNEYHSLELLLGRCMMKANEMNIQINRYFSRINP